MIICFISLYAIINAEEIGGLLMQVAIVGLGLSGTGVLKELLSSDQTSDALTIDIFETQDYLGKGKPYANDAKEILMNSSPKDLSADPDNPLDFVQWVGEHYPEIAKTHQFMPRPIFGHYLKAQMENLLMDPRVTLIESHINRLTPLEQETQTVALNQTDKPYSYEISTTNGSIYGPYDAVFLCIGHPPYADHYNLLGNKHYIHNPYPVLEKLNTLDQNKEVGIIGSGLSSIDVMRFLQRHYTTPWKHPITFYIRQLPFTVIRKPVFNRESPFSLSSDWIIQKRKEYQGRLPLDVLLQQIKTDFQAGAIDWLALKAQYGEGTIENIRYSLTHKDEMLERFQGYIDRMKPLLPEINMALSHADKQRLNAHYLADFEHFRNQLAEPAMLDIMKWLDDERIRIVSGLTDITSQADGFELTLGDTTEFVDYLINTTGFEKNVLKASQQDVFIKQLLDDHLITPGENNQWIQVTWPQSQLFSQTFGVHDHLYLLGFWIFGTQFGNNNVKLSRQSGHRAAKHFLEHFQKRTNKK